MSVTFISGLSPMINSFLDEKHALGYKYEENERYLKKFDALCADRFPEIDTVTKEAGLACQDGAHGKPKRTTTKRKTTKLEKHTGVAGNGSPVFSALIVTTLTDDLCVVWPLDNVPKRR